MANTTDQHEFEILLVDDKSTDELTLDLFEELGKNPTVSVLRQSVNGGPAKARNASLRAATGEWFGFLDADGSGRVTYSVATLHADLDLQPWSFEVYQ